jgi:hypothetical protein
MPSGLLSRRPPAAALRQVLVAHRAQEALDRAVPTEVLRPSDVAGNGPPCTIAVDTSTPVGKPLARMRPTLRSRTGSSARAASMSLRPSAGGGQLAFQALGDRAHFGDVLAGHQQRGRAEDFVVQRVLGQEGLGAGAEQRRRALAFGCFAQPAGHRLCGPACATPRW